MLNDIFYQGCVHRALSRARIFIAGLWVRIVCSGKTRARGQYRSLQIVGGGNVSRYAEIQL